MTDITLLDDRVLLHLEGHTREFPLAYQIHSRLIQTGELARLLAEHLREEGGEALPAGGTPVRMALPSTWGLVRLHLPISGLNQLQQPMHHLAWELDLHAPEQVEQYLFDYQETPPGETGSSELHLIAARQNLVAFCRTLCDELGWRLVALRAQDEGLPDFQLDLARAAAHREALAAESFPPVRAWRAAVLAAAALCLVGTALWFLVDRAGRPTLSPVTPPQTSAPADSLKAAVQAPPVDSSRVNAPPPATTGADTAWARLLEPLASQEDLLPDYFMVDATGILVRQEEGGRARLTRVLQRKGRVTRVSPAFYWLEFATPLPGGRLEEDPAQALRRMTLTRLRELAPRLGNNPARVLVQRRRAQSGTTWRFSAAARADSATGWLATVVPGLPPSSPKTAERR
jgi:hypothetical protein